MRAISALSKNKRVKGRKTMQGVSVSAIVSYIVRPKRLANRRARSNKRMGEAQDELKNWFKRL